MSRIQIVQGGQWGSEAKGLVAALLCQTDGINIAVRTGATNAGHTVYHKGREVKMQQLPVGWVVPGIELVLGAGALIDPFILSREIEEIRHLTGEDVRHRLYIDYRAGLHLPQHAERSKESNRHVLMGATGKGCSEALVDKIKLRGKGYKLFGQSEFAEGYQVIDTALRLNNMFDAGAKIQLEGTQGTLLDLNFGPYPYTTHKPTTPGQWMVEAGLSPSLPTDIVMVVRTFPIRVAGNSGPMPQEINWPMLAREINQKLAIAGFGPRVTETALQEFEQAVREAASMFTGPMPDGYSPLDQQMWPDRMEYRAALSDLYSNAFRSLPESTQAELRNLFEMTTVTKKMRRVSRLDKLETQVAARYCRPHRVFITFMNYTRPEFWGRIPNVLSREEADMIGLVEQWTKAPVTHLGYGPLGIIGKDTLHLRD